MNRETVQACVATDDKEQWAPILKRHWGWTGRQREAGRLEKVCACIWGVETVLGVRGALCHHHLIKHPNICRSYLSNGETNERGATRRRGERESENDILEKNGVCYYVTGFQKTIKGLCTYAYIYSYTDTHTHSGEHTNTAMDFLSPLPLF